MKNKIFFLALITGLMVLMSSCFSMIPTTYRFQADEDLSVEQSAVITFYSSSKNGYFNVKELNGDSISEAVYGRRTWSSNDRVRLTVPSGINRFTFDARFTSSVGNYSSSYRISNVTLEYYLEAGTEYRIKGSTKSLGFLKGDEFFVGIYDLTKGQTLLDEWKIGES